MSRRFVLMVCMAIVCCAATNDHAHPANNYDTAIVHASTRITKLTETQLKNIFLFHTTRWADGSKITVVVPPRQSDSFSILSIKYLDMLPSTFYEFYKTKLLNGNVNIVEASTEEMVVFKVAKSVNSIGFVNQSVVVNLGRSDGIKTIPIQEEK